MSQPAPTGLPVPSRPLADPPTSALPPIPRAKSPRKSLPTPTSHTPSKLRAPTSSSRPSLLPSPHHVNSTSDLPTLRTNSALGRGNPEEKTLRKTISIGAFPQPPSRPGTSVSMTSTTSSKKRRSDGGSTRSKRTPRASTASNASLLRSSQAPSLLNSSGDGKSIPLVAHRISDGHSSGASPPHSRSSSANGSYSTSATTLDDADDERGRPREDKLDSSAERRNSKTKESKGNVIVGVRVRPDPSGQDQSQSEGEWMVDGRRGLVAYRGKEGGDYYLDNVFGPYDDNAKVYDSSAKRLVRRVMEGYHGTVFAYGMTGTGKTFSMQGTASSPGVIPLAITDIFSYIRETPQREFLLRVSYLEIYNERIHDLLAAPTGAGIGALDKQEEIKLREDSKRGVYATPLKEEIVQSPTQLLRVIARGDHARRTSSTQYNSRSSRSHAVVQIVVESRERLPGTGATTENKRVAMLPGGVRVSTLSLIDLAGSERAADDKERRTEGAHINKSLLTLGTVIARLSGDKDKNGNPMDKEGKHLPYRDSKLTRLLQGALAGNSLISILCTIQIGSQGSVALGGTHTGETINTLKFAARAKNNIVSHAKKAAEEVGGGVNAGLLERYRTEIANLRSQLDNQQKPEAEKEEKQPEKEAEQRHEEQMLEMQLARTALKERIEHLNRLILCSKSTGVNSGAMSALGMHGRLSGGGSTEFGGNRSVRSSASQSTLGTPGGLLRHPSMGSIGPSQVGFPQDEEEEAGGEFADGRASLQAQNRALQSDLQDKNRYIVTLEKRLLQARRSSHSRMSMGFNKGTMSGTISEEGDLLNGFEEKDQIIADLRTRLEDKEKMVIALRSAARKRDMADLAPETSAAEFKQSRKTSPVVHQHQQSHSHDSNNSSLTSHATNATTSNSNNSHTSATNTPLSPSTPLSPLAILSPQKPKETNLPAAAARPPRKSVDEMSKMLDEMIQDKVESGHLVKSRTGSVRIAIPAASSRRVSAHVRRASSGSAGKRGSAVAKAPASGLASGSVVAAPPVVVTQAPHMASLVATLRERDSVWGGAMEEESNGAAI